MVVFFLFSPVFLFFGCVLIEIHRFSIQVSVAGKYFHNYRRYIIEYLRLVAVIDHLNISKQWNSTLERPWIETRSNEWIGYRLEPPRPLIGCWRGRDVTDRMINDVIMRRRSLIGSAGSLFSTAHFSSFSLPACRGRVKLICIIIGYANEVMQSRRRAETGAGEQAENRKMCQRRKIENNLKNCRHCIAFSWEM